MATSAAAGLVPDEHETRAELVARWAVRRRSSNPPAARRLHNITDRRHVSDDKPADDFEYEPAEKHVVIVSALAAESGMVPAHEGDSHS
ncbi:hypothetical protein [Mycolicibacterium sphagni]|uniref:Uncharacterized protein n=1 Tax=Mycolicibacterium sphagni TaxID=1786 RepID=A0A255DMC7_9MYCO|nr:hypothetical protein [Mycolicibacterium sphagni]OYN80404.1 hypothetical protein CG716_09735 [Mycolicibacterium sphagni]